MGKYLWISVNRFAFCFYPFPCFSTWWTVFPSTFWNYYSHLSWDTFLKGPASLQLTWLESQIHGAVEEHISVVSLSLGKSLKIHLLLWMMFDVMTCSEIGLPCYKSENDDNQTRGRGEEIGYCKKASVYWLICLLLDTHMLMYLKILLLFM